MRLGLATAALVLTALVWELARPAASTALARLRSRAREGGLSLLAGAEPLPELNCDPGRERRAEQRARRLLRSCVSEREWAMYRDLGFLRVFGRAGDRYAYLIYPHKPLVAYVPRTGSLLSEYCVAFPDESRPYGSARLPDSDDVLAKWMALRADERGLIADANMHLPGRQVDPEQVARDLARLAGWERAHGRGACDEPEGGRELAGGAQEKNEGTRARASMARTEHERAGASGARDRALGPRARAGRARAEQERAGAGGARDSAPGPRAGQGLRPAGSVRAA